MRVKTLSLIIPAYNEERTIHLILDKVRDVVLEGGVKKEVIIVNDGSKDGTVEAVERYIVANPDHGHPIHPAAAEHGQGCGHTPWDQRGNGGVPVGAGC